MVPLKSCELGLELCQLVCGSAQLCCELLDWRDQAALLVVCWSGSGQLLCEERALCLQVVDLVCSFVKVLLPLRYLLLESLHLTLCKFQLLHERGTFSLSLCQ